jgi:hypothetical protein
MDVETPLAADTETPAPVETPVVETPAPVADDARSLIRAAIDKQRNPDGVPETDEAKAARLRDEGGRFKAAEPGAKAAPVVPGGPAPDLSSNVTQQVSRPPGGFSPATKAIWDTLPESVKADIAKREAEVSTGFKSYEGLAPFAKLAESNGTTIQRALHEYNALENTFSQDPIKGVEAICQRLGVNPRALVNAMGHRYGLAAPQSQQAPGNGQQQHNPGQAPQPPVDPAAIARQVYEQVQQETSSRELTASVGAFSANPANKYFENVRESMAALLSTEQANSLKEAYDAACWLNPQVRAILLAEQATKPTQKSAGAVSQARAAAKAVSGAPASGSKPVAGSGDPNQSRRDLIREAVAAQRGEA